MGLPKNISEDGNDKLLRPILTEHQNRIATLEALTAENVRVQDGLIYESDYLSYIYVAAGDFYAGEGPTVQLVAAGTGSAGPEPTANFPLLTVDPSANTQAVGVLKIEGPGATGVGRIITSGDSLLDATSAVASSFPLIDLRARIRMNVTGPNTTCAFGMFVNGNHGTQPVVGTHPGFWFESSWVTDHQELVGKITDGTLSDSVVFDAAYPGTTFQWLRAAADIGSGAVRFYSSADGNTWDPIGTLSGMSFTPFKAKMDCAFGLVVGDAAGASTLYLDYFKLTVPIARLTP